MKKRVIYGKSVGREDEGYVFFAEALDEMLFDYTLDTYKPSTHNSSTLSYEAIQILDGVKDGSIEKAHLDEVMDELRWMLSIDPIAESLLTVDPKELLKGLSSSNQSLALAKVSLVSTALAPERYIRECVAELRILLSEGKQKKKIRVITRQWMTSILQVGYSRRFVSSLSRQAFFDPTKSALRFEDRFSWFLSQLDYESKEYSILIGGDPLFMDLRKPIHDLGCAVSAVAPEGPHTEWQNRRASSRFPIFVQMQNIKAKDPYAASKIAQDRLQNISAIYSVFHHKKALTWDPLMEVVSHTTNVAQVIGPAVNPVTRVVDAFPNIAAERMHSALSELELHDESFDQFARVVSLHGAAIASESTTVQLLNIWSALEASVPNFVTGAKVSSVIDALSPYLVLEYCQSLLEDLLADLFRWNKRRTKEALNCVAIKDVRPANKLLHFIILNDHMLERKKYETELQDFPLLRNRFNDIREKFLDSATIERNLKQHQLKVRWQIRRIYRARNLYIHTGHRILFADSLVENAHGYLDCFLRGIFFLMRGELKVKSLEQAWVISNERKVRWLDKLKAKPKLSAENLSSVLLGPSAR